MDAAKRLESLERASYGRAIREHLGERLRAYYERAQHMRVTDNRLAELIERLSKRLEEQKLSGSNEARATFKRNSGRH